MKKLWEVWDYRGPKPQLVDVVRGRAEAVNRAKILAPSAVHWHRTHKIYRADKS